MGLSQQETAPNKYENTTVYTVLYRRILLVIALLLLLQDLWASTFKSQEIKSASGYIVSSIKKDTNPLYVKSAIPNWADITPSSNYELQKNQNITINAPITVNESKTPKETVGQIESNWADIFNLTKFGR